MKETEIQRMSVHGDNEVVGRETDIQKETKYNKITLVGNCSQKAKDRFDLINKFINSLVDRKVDCYIENNDIIIEATQDEYDNICKSDILFKTLYDYKELEEIEEVDR